MCGHLKYGRTVNRSSALKKRAANEWCKESGIVTGVKAEEEGFVVGIRVVFNWWVGLGCWTHSLRVSLHRLEAGPSANFWIWYRLGRALGWLGGLEDHP